MNRECHRIKLVNNRKARLVAEIIDARDIEQVIERKLVLAKLRHLTQIARRNREGRFTAKLCFLLDLWPQKFSERCEKVLTGHAITSLSCSISLRFCSRKEGSTEIFSWSFIKPSSSASGRGGHPET